MLALVWLCFLKSQSSLASIHLQELFYALGKKRGRECESFSHEGKLMCKFRNQSKFNVHADYQPKAYPLASSGRKGERRVTDNEYGFLLG